MPECDYCDQNFSGDRERLEHELDEHGDDMTSHEKDEKKNELNRLEQRKKTRKHERKRMVKYAGISLLVIGLVAGGGFYAYQNIDVGPARTNQSLGIGTPIHWHAPYTIRVCGDRKVLSGGPVLAHTHGQTKFHLEGVRKRREQATLDWIIDQLGGNFSNTGIMGYREPESCPGSTEPGNLTVKVNGNRIKNPESYVVRDGDVIRITYR